MEGSPTLLCCERCNDGRLPLRFSPMSRSFQNRTAKVVQPRQNVQRLTRRRPQGSSQQPQMLETNVRLTHRYRFAVTSAFAGAVTFTDIAGAMGTFGTVTNTTVVAWIASLRIKRVEMWTPPPSQGATATCSIDWFSTNQQPAMEFSDTSVSTAIPAHVRCVPPAKSLAAFWQAAGNAANAFELVAPAGTIIDIHVDGILIDADDVGVTYAVATAVIGKPYYLSLDGPASNLLVPVSMVTTH